MTERSLTPSPHRSQKLERGVFSSVSALSLYKQSIEERKQLQSTSPTTSKKTLVQKPKSPSRVRPALKRFEKSPERQPASPLKAQNRIKYETEPKQDPELLKLQENFKNVSLQLVREKKINSRLEGEIKELKKSQKDEINSLLIKIERIQESMQETIENYKEMAAEKEKAYEECRKAKEKYEDVKEQVRTVVGVLVSVVSLFFSNFDDSDSLVGIEKFRIGAKVKELVAEKVKEIMEMNSIDLSRQVNEVNSWMILNNLPKQMDKSAIFSQGFKENAVPFLKTNSENPKNQVQGNNSSKEPKLSGKNHNSNLKDSEIIYTVEYFDKEPSEANSRHKLKPSLPTENSDFSSTPKEFALALYDFEGEKEDDLSFFNGEAIEILQQCESGWWIGRLNGKTGAFPYNFVQLINP